MKKKFNILSIFFILMFLCFGCQINDENNSGGSSTYNPEKYALVYYANGGTGEMKGSFIEKGKEITIESNSFTKTGYTFTGWSTQKDGKGVIYKNNAKIKPNEDTKLYAQWAANTYTVKFDKNDNDATGDAADIKTSYDEEIEIPADTFSKSGYKIACWNTKADGTGTNYWIDSDVKNLTDENNAVVTLYALWREKDSNWIHYELNGGKFSETLIMSFKSNEKVELKTPVKAGYIFDGWYDTKGFSGSAITGWEPNEKTEDVTLYAKWTANTYTVKFDKNDDDATGDAIADIQATYDKSFKIPANTFSKKGYIFVGWNTEKDGKGTNYWSNTAAENLTDENNAVVTLYAQWKEQSFYRIIYELNGGSHTGVKETFVKTEDVKLKTPTKTGYTFDGWYETKNFSGSVITGWKQNEKPFDVILYAKWTANTYTVKFDANTILSDTVADIQATYDNELTLPTSTTLKDGYKLSWNTKADGSGMIFAVGAKLKNITNVNNETVTLYAQWLVSEKFVKIKTSVIMGTESWTPSSSVFIKDRKFKIAAFEISDHEVTQAEYKSVMGEVPSSMASTDGNACDNPVNNVSWYDAIVYCNKRSIQEGLTPCYTINGFTNPSSWGEVPTNSYSSDKWKNVTCDFTANGYRLPTEAEWEWAARGDENYLYAGSDTVSDVAWYSYNSSYDTHEVKTKKANGYGLYDMSGNVKEWCWDRYTYSSSSSISADTPATGASSGSYRSYRGGSYSDSSYYCYVNNQNSMTPYSKSSYYGFRLVRTVN